MGKNGETISLACVKIQGDSDTAKQGLRDVSPLKDSVSLVLGYHDLNPHSHVALFL